MTPTTEQLKDLLAKVTQGEWRSGDDPEGDYPHKISIHTEDHFYIAVLDNSTQEQANATLIAMAPTLAAEVVRLRDALAEIAGRHIPDQPAAYGGDEAEWATRQHTELRRIARQAIDGTGEK